MSERMIDVDLTTHTEIRADKVPIPDESQREQFRAKLAQVLDRTLTIDRLKVDLPEDLTGGWCATDSLSIAQWELRGYQIDTQYATKNSLNDTADGRARIADVVHMIRPKWMKEEEDKMIQKRYVETHLRDRRKQKEESDFIADNARIGMPPILQSQAETVTGTQIEESLFNK